MEFEFSRSYSCFIACKLHTNWFIFPTKYEKIWRNSAHIHHLFCCTAKKTKVFPSLSTNDLLLTFFTKIAKKLDFNNSSKDHFPINPFLFILNEPYRQNSCTIEITKGFWDILFIFCFVLLTEIWSILTDLGQNRSYFSKLFF